nr:hypothetical protein [uncultured bacterium]
MAKNKNQKISRKKILVSALIISFVMANFLVIQKQTFAQEEGSINELGQEIEQRKKEIEVLQKEIDAYQEQINEKQKEAKTLRNQVAILENQIAKVELDIAATEKRIEETNLEIQTLNLQIKQKEAEIDQQKKKIAEYIRLIYQNDQVSYLEIIMLNDNFSEFFDYLKYIEEIHNDLKGVLDKLKTHKKELEIQKSNFEERKRQEEELKDKLSQQKSELEERSTGREILLVQTRLTERQYQNYLYQLQLEQQQINSDIITLEKKIREELGKKEKEEIFREFGPARLGWPVSPDRGITAYFHDPDYPFRYIFEHPAIDIRAYQGTSIKAAEGGYVAKIKFKGDASYAYIMLIHNDGLSTVYGHVSGVNVKEDEFVTKGQIIGATGGIPGGIGSGNLSTGPHLHFEVRLNGIPVNPLEYLP